MLAASEGNLKQAQEALRNGAGIDKPDRDKDTPLMTAARQGHVEMVRFLIRNGAKPNKIVEGSSALHSAIRFGNKLDIVQALVEGGADPKTKYYDETMIAVAAEAGQLPVIKWLVAQGVDPHAIDKNSNTTAVDKARWHKQKEIIEYLQTLGVVSAREAGRKLSRAFAREFGGKPVEHSRGFLTNSKFHGYKAQFHIDTEDAGI
jgi:ankyrin repeat protein